ncbi:immunoglobulin-binding protein 1 [Lucilia sericata]|uniref:immunoglobulin-binding protein 1 n=1 Tax=Lucilia sericata TaxID=13632 RepID=UPI0018A84E11|nr:immunoglobulin-binding protein 1 [Lucilia sericata]
MSADNSTDNRKLEDIFLEGWEIFEFLDETTIDTNGTEFQSKVKLGMQQFELATTMVSQIGMFSSNEIIDEVPTESLQYLLLPYFLGKLAVQRNEQDRADALRIAEIYFRDFLQRCHEYQLCEAPKSNDDDKSDKQVSGCIDTQEQLVASAVARNNKIAQFKRKKELDAQIKQMKLAVKSNNVDDEVKRDFFMKYINRSIIDANEEMQNVKLERGVVEMRKQRLAEFGTTKMDDIVLPPGSVIGPNPFKDHAHMPDHDHAHGHSHGHGHSHSHGPPRHMHMPPKPKPMQPFIITKDATQKAVFGLGYPSLPIMTVDEFYQQRVDQGIFPDAEKMAQINKEKAIAAAQDPEIQEEEEKAALEEQIENDDPEYIARMRRMDEYKDVVRRGDGNRHNRS